MSQIKRHSVELFLELVKPSYELKIADLHGQKVFPVSAPTGEVLVFVEFNGYRKCVAFPAEPAPHEPTRKE